MNPEPGNELQFKVSLARAEPFMNELRRLRFDVGHDADYEDPTHYMTVIVRDVPPGRKRILLITANRFGALLKQNNPGNPGPGDPQQPNCPQCGVPMSWKVNLFVCPRCQGHYDVSVLQKAGIQAVPPVNPGPKARTDYFSLITKITRLDAEGKHNESEPLKKQLIELGEWLRKYGSSYGVDVSDIDPLRILKSGGEKPSRLEVIRRVKPFLPKSQLEISGGLFRSEEGDYFVELFQRLANTFETMPRTYQTEETPLDDKIIHLHYFSSGSDWYIAERDVEPEQHQAFGYAILNQDLQNAEWGYISIEELKGIPQVELDFHWKPKTFKEVMRDVHLQVPSPEVSQMISQQLLRKGPGEKTVHAYNYRVRIWYPNAPENKTEGVMLAAYDEDLAKQIQIQYPGVTYEIIGKAPVLGDPQQPKISGQQFKFRIEWWTSPLHGMIGTIRTDPENYYVASIKVDKTLDYQELEAMTRDIDQLMVRQWFQGQTKRKWSPSQVWAACKRAGVPVDERDVCVKHYQETGELPFQTWPALRLIESWPEQPGE